MLRLTRYLASERVQAGLSDAEDTGDEVASLLTEEATLRARMDEIADAFADGEMTRAQVARATAKAGERLTAIGAQLARLGDKGALGALALPPGWTTLAGLHDAVDAVQGRLEGMSLDERRAVVSRTLEAVTLLPRGRGSRGLVPEKILLRHQREGRAMQQGPARQGPPDRGHGKASGPGHAESSG